MQRKIFKTGHSLVVALSKKVLDKAGLKLGDAIEVELIENKIIIGKSKRGKQMDLGLKVRSKL